jgi:tetratricopeptide (TPR) repeat protein
VRPALLLLIVIAVAWAQPAAPDVSLADLLARYQAEPHNALLCEQIGVAYVRSSQLEEAAQFFRRAVQLDPSRVSAEKNLGTVLWFSGSKTESESIFNSLEKRIPNDPVPQLYLGLAAYDRKEYSLAAAHFRRAGPLASDNPELFPTLVDTYLSARRFADASRLLETRIDSGDVSSQTYRWLAEAYDGQQLPEKAYRAYSNAIRQEPRAEENYLALAEFSMEHGNTPFAQDILQRGLHQRPGAPKLLLEAGLASALAGKFEDAKHSILAAHEADPRSSPPLLALGVIQLQSGDAASAAEYFRKAKELAPNDARSYYLRALALSRSASSHEPAVRAEVVAELHSALKLNPRQPNAFVLLGEVELAGGRADLASAEFKRALRIDPAEPTALYQYALLCRRQGNTAEAQRLFRAFQQTKKKSEDQESQLVLVLRMLK